MKKVALLIVATLVLAMAAPAFAQPFADVPTDHWAYDAIAELAAKGLIEGYPDGSFKGDRALTRYEMAMVVARILARIEAIVIPPPEVRKADLAALTKGYQDADRAIQGKLATVQRLVNEFRAELAALGVRVTAIEEELNAIKSRLDNTKITGDFYYFYDMRRYPTPWGDSLSGEPMIELARIRLTYTGAVARGVSVTLRARYRYFSSTSGILDFDRLYIDLNNGPFGLQYRVGRQVLVLGPVGLLFDNSTMGERRDGLRVQGRFGGLTVIGAYFWQQSTQTQNSAATVVTAAYTAVGRVAFSLFPGWTFGLNVRSDRNPFGATPGAYCHPGFGPTQDACTGWGWSFDFQGNVTSSVELLGEYAQYTRDRAVGYGWTQPGNAWKVQANIDLSRISSTLQPSLSIWYRSWSGYRPPPGTTTFTFGESPLFVGGLWDMNGYYTPGMFSWTGMSGVASVGGSLSLNLLPNWSADFAYELSRRQFTPAWRMHEILAGVNWAYARNTTIRFEYFRWWIGGSATDLDHYFRVWIQASW